MMVELVCSDCGRHIDSGCGYLGFWGILPVILCHDCHFGPAAAYDKTEVPL